MGRMKYGHSRQKNSIYTNDIPVYFTNVYTYIVHVGTNSIMGTRYLFFKDCLIMNHKLFLMVPVHGIYLGSLKGVT